MNTLIRRALAAWFLWRSERRFYRAYPHLHQRAEAIRSARRSHKPTKHIIATQQQEMLRLLREGK